MKQHITVEQLNELSDGAKERLRGWWMPRRGDLFANEALFSAQVIRDSEDQKFYVEDVLCENPGKIHNSYPLLSIGQMIEFLDSDLRGVEKTQLQNANTGEKVSTDWCVNTIRYLYIKSGLCDALWDAVKGQLERLAAGELVEGTNAVIVKYASSPKELSEMLDKEQLEQEAYFNS